MNNQGEKQQNSKDTSSVVVEKLLSSRSLIISGEINQELAEKVATQLLILQEMGDEPIKLFINIGSVRGIFHVTVCRRLLLA